MRRLIGMPLSLLVLVAAAGCGDDGATDSTTTSSAPDASATSTTAGGEATSTTAAQSEEDPTDTTVADDPGVVTTTGDLAYPAAPYEWTPECIAALVTTLKIMESALSAIDWSTASSGDTAEVNAQFSDETDALWAEAADRGCTTDMVSTANGLAYVRQLSVVHVPGAVGYIDYSIANLP